MLLVSVPLMEDFCCIFLLMTATPFFLLLFLCVFGFLFFFFKCCQVADLIKVWKEERVWAPLNVKDRLILNMALHVDISQLTISFVVDFSSVFAMIYCQQMGVVKNAGKTSDCKNNT